MLSYKPCGLVAFLYNSKVSSPSHWKSLNVFWGGGKCVSDFDQSAPIHCEMESVLNYNDTIPFS